MAVIGSANINDRSLNGNGDTELAAVIRDDAGAAPTDIGQGVTVVTRQFARNLRMTLWRKHLGMLVDVQTTGVKKQSSSSGVDLEKPISTQSIAAIKKISAANRLAYSDVFLHTARDSFGLLTGGQKAYTTYYHDRQGLLREVPDQGARPALQPPFMSAPKVHDIAKAMNRLSQVCGFWVQMPLKWGMHHVATPKAPVSPQMIARGVTQQQTEQDV